MVNVKNLFRIIPRRYRWFACLICFIYIIIFLHYSRPSSELQEEVTIINNTNNSNSFDLYDDDDVHLLCPSDIQFNISNRHHLAIIIGPKLEPFLWKNFRSLLCTGVDVYVMLDEAFNINSLSRGDEFKERQSRSIRSYTNRFLHISDELLDKIWCKLYDKISCNKIHIMGSSHCLVISSQTFDKCLDNRLRSSMVSCTKI